MPIFEMNDVRFVKTVSDTVIGEGKRKMDILVRTTEQYETKLCLAAWDKQIEKLIELRPKADDKMNIKFTVKSSSKDEVRFFANVNLYGFEIVERASEIVSSQVPVDDWTGISPEGNEDLPF